MDGTLLDSRGQLSTTNARLIKEATLPLTLISARAPMEMKEVIDQLGLQGPQIAFNGGLVYQYDSSGLTVFYQQTLEDTEATRLIGFINQHYPHLSQSYYDLNHWYTYKMDAGIDYESQLTGQKPTLIGEEQFVKPASQIFKIMLVTFDAREMRTVKAELEGLNILNIVIQQSGDYYLEITHRFARKSVGIDYVIRKEGLSASELVAFGDGENDLPMFEKVGLAVAMANASDHVKEKAQMLTESNDEDGVGKALHRLLA